MQYVTTLHNQAVDLINKGYLVQAHPLLVKVLQADPDHADSYFLLGLINLEVGSVTKAARLIETALEYGDEDMRKAMLCKAYALGGNFDSLKSVLAQTSSESMSYALAADTMAVALSIAGMHTEALPYYRRAVSLDSKNANFAYNSAIAYQFTGDFESAKSLFIHAINHNPSNSKSHYALAGLLDKDESTQWASQFETLIDKVNGGDDQLRSRMALWQLHHRLGNYDKAFEHLFVGKSTKRMSLDYEVENDVALFAKVKQLSDQFPKPQTQGFVDESYVDESPIDESPIFIIGMPRSGTTVVERILSQHSEVASAGEIQSFSEAVRMHSSLNARRYLDVFSMEQGYRADALAIGSSYLDKTSALRGKASKLIDKLPFNFFYADLILRALPGAKIICLMRDPMDTCWGNFKNLFATDNYYYNYSYSLQDIGRFYVAYHELMMSVAETWKERFKIVDYQQLVTQPERVTSDLLSFCQLEAEPQCFAMQNNPAPVDSASSVQVRESINTQHVGGWRKYQDQLEILKKYLAQQEVLSYSDDI